MAGFKTHFNFQSGNAKGNNFYKVIHIEKENPEPQIAKEYKREFASKIFSADLNQQFIDHKNRVILIGLGKKDQFNIRKLSEVYMSLGKMISKWEKVGLEIHVPLFLIEVGKDFSLNAFQIGYHWASSLEIGVHYIDMLSTSYSERKLALGPIHFVCTNLAYQKDIEKGIQEAKLLVPLVNQAREIQHLPSNFLDSVLLEMKAAEIAKAYGLKMTVFDKARLSKEKMGGILAVNKGSKKDPKLILLEYRPDSAGKKPPIALVGKGLTFDSGGISIKPSGDMHEMKYDMSGAAAVLYAIAGIAAKKLRTPVIAALGVAENMPDASAIKPGDVFTAYNGTTVEVQNTDAEGRLVLGDVLSYVCEKYKPKYLLDLATLTGAVVIALGNEAAGLMTNSNHLKETINSASNMCGDRVWELPLWDEYGEDLKSDIADIRNITGGRGGGTLSAAQFLKKFVKEETEWAHIDIAGTAWRSKQSGTQCSGPTGYGVRLLVEVCKNL